MLVCSLSSQQAEQTPNAEHCSENATDENDSF